MTEETTSPEGDKELSPFQKQPEGAKETLVEPAEGAETKEVEKEGQIPPEPRTYAQAEWDKRQSAWDKQQAKLQKQVEDALVKVAESEEHMNTLLAQGEEGKLASWLKAVETEEAPEISSRARQVVEAHKQLLVNARAFEKQKREFSAIQAKAEEATKTLTAHKLIETHQLDADDDTLSRLLEASDPVVMENIALKLRLEKGVAEKTLPKKIASGTGKGEGVHIDKLPASEALGMLIEQDERKRGK